MKIKTIIIASLIILVLTGCSNNKLKCTQKSNSTTTNIIATFSKEGKINTLEFDRKTIYDKFDAYIDIHYYDLKEQYTSLDNIKGITYEVKENKNDITTKLNINYNELPNIDNRLIPIKRNETIEIAKEKLINEGYICK